jgi:hypothetical protein
MLTLKQTTLNVFFQLTAVSNFIRRVTQHFGLPSDKQQACSVDLQAKTLQFIACLHLEEVQLHSFLMLRTKCRRVVLYGCGTWSLTFREESRLRVFENKVLRRIFGPKRDEVTGEWRRLHNKELYVLYSSTNIIRVIKSRRQMGRTCGTYGGEKRCIQGFSGET